MPTIRPAVWLTIALSAPIAHADIIEVPFDVPTIQGAVDIASDGDEIVIHPAIYNETLNLFDKSIVLRSLDPEDSALSKGRSSPRPAEKSRCNAVHRPP